MAGDSPRTCLKWPLSGDSPRTCLKRPLSGDSPRTCLKRPLSGDSPRTCPEWPLSGDSPRTRLGRTGREGAAAGHRPRGGARPGRRRHRPDHPEAVPEADRALRLRGVPVLRLDEGSGVRAAPARVRGCGDPRRRAQLRLRLLARARRLGARGRRLPVRARAELRRHLPRRTRSSPGSRRSFSSRATSTGSRRRSRSENELTVDLEALEISHPDGLRVPFEFDPFARHMLLEGSTTSALTLKREERIAAFERSHPARSTRPSSPDGHLLLQESHVSADERCGLHRLRRYPPRRRASRSPAGPGAPLAASGMAFFVAHVLRASAAASLDASREHLGLRRARAARGRRRRGSRPARSRGTAPSGRCWPSGSAAGRVGDISWSVVYGGNPPFPSLADGFYLAFYPPTYLALALLVRGRLSRFNASVWLDGLTAALAVAAVGAAILLEVVLHETRGKLARGGHQPRLPARRHRPRRIRRRRLRGRPAGGPGRDGPRSAERSFCRPLADGVYLYQSAAGTYVAGTFLDALWPAALLLLALAAWMPAKRRRRVRLEGRPLAAAPLSAA